MSRNLTQWAAEDVAKSAKNLYEAMLANDFVPVDAWEFTLNYFKGSGSD